MKSYILLFFIILISICSCRKTVQNISTQDKNVFSPALKKEILRIIGVKNKEDGYFKSKICNVIVLQDIEREKKCVVIISLNKGIGVKNATKFIPLSDKDYQDTQIDHKIINGYTFVGTELVGCSIISDSCNNGLIDEKGLIPITDSIPGHPNALNHDDSDATYDAPMRIYQIMNADSLELIKSFFMPNL